MAKKKAVRKKQAKKSVRKKRPAAKKEAVKNAVPSKQGSKASVPGKKKGADDLYEKTRDKFGSGLITKLTGSITKSGPTRILKGWTWGPPSLDYICTGRPGIGIVRGRVYEIYGPNMCGKTTLCLNAIAEIQKAGGDPVFIDAEHSLDVSLAEGVGVDTDALDFVQPDFGEQAIEVAREYIKNGADAIFIDSVAALVPKVILEGAADKVKIGAKALLMSDAMQKLSSIAYKKGCSLIFTNQIRYKIGVLFGSPETTTGGEALKFYASVRVDMRTSMTEKNAIRGTHAELTGKTTQGKDIMERLAAPCRLKCVKSKFRSPFGVTEVSLIFGEGFDAEQDLFDFCANLGLIGKVSGGYRVDGKRVRSENLEDFADRAWEILKEADLKNYDKEFRRKMAQSGED